jgi:RimJ/RimL family protein N-acetyltransferase
VGADTGRVSSTGDEPAIIATARLDLLPIRVEYAEEMAVVLSDPALYVFIGGNPPTAAGLRTRYQAWIAGSPDPSVTWCNWVIRRRDTGSLTGTVQATIAGPAGNRTAEIAWVVGTRWQGRGIATEAARGLVSWLGQRGVRTVSAHIHPDHSASAAVAAAAGLNPTSEWQDGEVRWCLKTSPAGDLSR